MQCPTDGTTLTMSERSGIEIDYCPTCRGVWLDRGELDKIIERSLSQVPAAPAAAPAGSRSTARPQLRPRSDRGYSQRGQRAPYRKKKKESWLSELFD